MKKIPDHITKVMDYLKDIGALNISLIIGKKHPKIDFSYNGATRTYRISGSTSDSQRAWKNSVRDIRHLLGLVNAA